MPVRQAHIVGIGQSAFTKRGAQSAKGPLGLAVRAISGACDDAGIKTSDLEGFATFPDETVRPGALQAALNMPDLQFSAQSFAPGGGGSITALGLAAMAVESGQANYIAVFRSIAIGASPRYGAFQPHLPHAEILDPFGVTTPALSLAFVTRRHMHEFGTTKEQLGAWAVSCRENANRNPHAVMKDRPMAMQDYLAARPIAEPFGLLDCCLETDGAAALIVTTEDRAADLRKKPVRVLGTEQGSSPRWGAGHFGFEGMPKDAFLSQNGGRLGERLFSKTGLSPKDIDVAQIYDAFTGMALINLEDYGFCARGESGPYVGSGATAWPSGETPMNTAGGMLSEAYVHGLNLVTEGVRQLRGESTSQVDGAETCFVSGGGGSAPTSAALLGRAA